MFQTLLTLHEGGLSPLMGGVDGHWAEEEMKVSGRVVGERTEVEM